VQLEGDAEKQLQKAFVQKRKHEEVLQQIEAVKSFIQNKNSVVFGEQANNLLAQLETYKMVSQN
jgi:DNA-binding FrmR family transcriptional regulator